MIVSKDSLVGLVKRANSIMLKYKPRPKAESGRLGGLVELPGNTRPIIIGDLHANLENLQAILEHDNNNQRVQNGECTIILLGDVIHNDQTGKMRETHDSMLTLEFVFELINKFPKKVIYLRGNHDTFDERVVKSQIAQGAEFKNYLIEQRGEAYVKEADRFFDNLPVFLIARDFVITHAGPVRGGTTRDELINIYQDQDKYMQLQWNRIHEFRGTPNSKEYDKEDIRKTLEKLKLPLDTPFIVGHNPLWNTGNRSGVWIDALGIKNHHILYSGWGTRAPYFTQEGSELVVKFAIEPQTKVFYA